MNQIIPNMSNDKGTVIYLTTGYNQLQCPVFVLYNITSRFSSNSIYVSVLLVFSFLVLLESSHF